MAKKITKGFSLVEMVIVIAIIAVLLLLIIPVGQGIIRNTQEQAIKTECQESVVAAQRLASDRLNNFETVDGLVMNGLVNDIKELAEVKGTISRIEISNGTIIHLTYTLDGRNCTYCSASGCTKYNHTEMYNLGVATDIIPDGTLVSNGVLPGTSLADVADEFGIPGNVSVDSTATNGNYTGLISEEIAHMFEGTNLKSWSLHMEGSIRTILVSDIDISQVSAGDWVKVIRYNPSRNTYTAGYWLVSKSSGSDPYNIFSQGGTSAVRWVEIAKASTDYDVTLENYNKQEPAVSATKPVIK